MFVLNLRDSDAPVWNNDVVRNPWIGGALVLCLGLVTFNALRHVLGNERLGTIETAIQSPMSLGRARIWCQAHTGAMGQNNRNRGGVDRVTRDWEAMRVDVGR